VSIVRSTDGSFGNPVFANASVFLGLEPDAGGKLQPAPPPSQLRLEVIGDSISSGGSKV
jgi:hypothetical protein